MDRLEYSFAFNHGPALSVFGENEVGAPLTETQHLRLARGVVRLCLLGNTLPDMHRYAPSTVPDMAKIREIGRRALTTPEMFDWKLAALSYIREGNDEMFEQLGFHVDSRYELDDTVDDLYDEIRARPVYFDLHPKSTEQVRGDMSVRIERHLRNFASYKLEFLWKHRHLDKRDYSGTMFLHSLGLLYRYFPFLPEAHLVNTLSRAGKNEGHGIRREETNPDYARLVATPDGWENRELLYIEDAHSRFATDWRSSSELLALGDARRLIRELNDMERAVLTMLLRGETVSDIEKELRPNMPVAEYVASIAAKRKELGL